MTEAAALLGILAVAGSWFAGVLGIKYGLNGARQQIHTMSKTVAETAATVNEIDKRLAVVEERTRGQ